MELRSTGAGVNKCQLEKGMHFVTWAASKCCLSLLLHTDVPDFLDSWFEKAFEK